MTTQETSTRPLPDDLRDVRHKLVQLADQERIDALIDLVIELLARMRESNNALATRLANALRELYGRKSQKVSFETLSSLLAALGEEVPAGAAEAANGTPPPAQEADATGSNEGQVPQPPEPPKPPSGRGGRSPLPANLPRRPRKVPVADEERRCPRCGGERVCIGYRTSEVLEFTAPPPRPWHAPLRGDAVCAQSGGCFSAVLHRRAIRER